MAESKGSKSKTIGPELVKAAGGLKQEKGEDLQVFVQRLCGEVSKLSDEEFGGLSPDAQAWFNDAAVAINAGKKVAVDAAFFGAGGVKAKPEQKKETVQPVATKPVAAKKPPARKASDGVAHKVRVAVVAKPTIDFEAVAKRVGVEPKVGSHAWNIFNEAKRVMELVTAAHQ